LVGCQESKLISVLKLWITLLLFSAPNLLADGLVGGAPDLASVQFGGSPSPGALNGTQWFAVLWLSLICGIAGLPSVSVGRIRLDWLTRDMPPTTWSTETWGLLLTPGLSISAALFLLLNALLLLPWHFTAGPMLAMLLGGSSMLYFQEPLARRVEAVDGSQREVAGALAVAIAELGNIGLVVFLSVLVPYETAAMTIFAFVLGQVVAARASALEAGETPAFRRLKTMTVEQGIVLTALVYLLQTAFAQSPLIACELFFALLLMRLVAMLVPLLTVLFHDAELIRDWCGTALIATIICVVSLFCDGVFPRGVFSMHDGVWWVLAAAVGAGTFARLLQTELRTTLISRDPILTQIGCGGVAIGGVCMAAEISGFEPFQFVLSGVPYHVEWMFAFILFTFGWTLPNSTRVGNSAAAVFHPAGPALVLAGMVVFGEMFDDEQNHFSLVNSKNFAGLAVGFLMVGLLRWTDSVRGASPARMASAALGLFVIQFSLAIGVPLFSVFGAFAAYGVLALVDSLDPPPLDGPGRFGGFSQLMLGLLGTGVAIEVLRVINGADGGVPGAIKWYGNALAAQAAPGEVQATLGSALAWFGAWIQADWLRFGLASLIVSGGLYVGIRHHHRDCDSPR
jgi:hypothetical protein